MARYRAITNRQRQREEGQVSTIRVVSRETAEPAPPADQLPTPEPEPSEELSYRDLQAQAKARDIPANQSREDLEVALGYD